MSMNVYTEEYVIPDTDVDCMERMTPEAVLTLFQNIAGVHANSFDLGYDRMHPMDLAWVLTKTCVQMHVPPMRGQRIRITTWPGQTRRCFYPRYFLVHDEAGQLICECNSLWVIIGTKTREMFVDREGVFPLPDTSDLPAPFELPKRLKVPETPDEVTTRSPRYSEIDVNNHLNNAKYLSWICDMAGLSAFREHRIKDFYIVYSSEIRPGDTVTLSRFRAGDGDIFSGVNQNGLSCFQAQLHWTSLSE